MKTSFKDNAINTFDNMLRTLFAVPHSARPLPRGDESAELTPAEAKHSAGLMRVNHVGEVCAQALYTGQIIATGSSCLQEKFARARKEETDHLAWCRTRLDHLDARSSVLNPVWYMGALIMGYVAGRLGDERSLGFLKETEQQVVAHLQHHLESLPQNDTDSRAIVTAMLQDEAGHAQMAEDNGAKTQPNAVNTVMRGISRIMTTVAYRI